MRMTFSNYKVRNTTLNEFLIMWFVNVIALLAVVKIIAGVSIDSWKTAMIAALILGLLNVFLRPLIVIMTLPLNIFSLGVFTLFINGFMFYLAARFVEGFSVVSFWSAFWAAILFSIISFLLNFLLAPKTVVTRQRQRDHRRYYNGDDVIDVGIEDK